MIAQESDIELCVHTVCSPYNAEMLFDIYKKLLEIGAARWRVFMNQDIKAGSVNNKEEFEFDSYYKNILTLLKKSLKTISKMVIKILQIRNTTYLKQLS